MCPRRYNAGFLKDRGQRSFSDAHERTLQSYAVPEKMLRILTSPAWHRQSIDGLLDGIGQRQEHRSAASVLRKIRQRVLSHEIRSRVSIAISPIRKAV